MNTNQLFHWVREAQLGKALWVRRAKNEQAPPEASTPFLPVCVTAADVPPITHQSAITVSFRSGHVFVFRGRLSDRFKLLWWDGQGLYLFYKRLEQGQFVWPHVKTGAVHLTQAELALLLEGLDWRPPARKNAPENSA